ncbi:YidH family protein [Vibrio sonorensis]|uniref:YidH family protein n=1 Tax=Vibrio sonorensis TaxID=1004316 RepID=UPI0008DAD1E5|nr:DUF202 domain-containing protein [Vibrio sonorensis]
MKIGNDPDYRFSLANERTFLAWIRTSLAFLATSVAIDILAQTHHTQLLQHSEWLSKGLAALSCTTAVWAIFRWYQNEKAMRLDAPLHYTKGLYFLSLSIVFFAGFIGYAIA